MDNSCDKCQKPAKFYVTEIDPDGQTVVKHLCEQCAVAEGIAVKANLSIAQLLEDFIQQGRGLEAGSELSCDVCGLTFRDFLEQKLLGCPHDYDAFEKVLLPLLEREQEGGAQHVGKVPHRAGHDQRKQTSILRLRAQLKAAIAAEDYERAAGLRDQIKELEKT